MWQLRKFVKFENFPSNYLLAKLNVYLGKLNSPKFSILQSNDRLGRKRTETKIRPESGQASFTGLKYTRIALCLHRRRSTRI